MQLKAIYFWLVFLNSLVYPAAITNDVGGGRLGDRIIGYVRSKLLAEQYGVPYYLSYFKYADWFNFFYEETQLPSGSNVKTIDHLRYFIPTQNIIYRCPVWLMPECIRVDESDNTTHFDRIKKDTKFKQLLKPCKKPSHKIELPFESVTIAIHVRQPSGALHDLRDCNFSHLLHSEQFFDVNRVEQSEDAHRRYLQSCTGRSNRDRGMDEKFPYKFPPLQFYIDQLAFCVEKFSNKSIFVFIFTDWDNPTQIRTVFQEKFNNENITITSHNFNHHEEYIIDDLLNMARFDYLIRSNSGFAQSAQLIGDFKMAIYPKKMKWFDNCLVIQEVGYDEQ